MGRETLRTFRRVFIVRIYTKVEQNRSACRRGAPRRAVSRAGAAGCCHWPGYSRLFKALLFQCFKIVKGGGENIFFPSNQTKEAIS